MLKRSKQNKFDRVFIHTGLPKTGSSFLQSALESIELQKEFSDTTYPVLHKVDDFQFIRSGNGLEIAKVLVESLTPDFDKNKLLLAFNELLSCASKKKNLLISSEWFSSASPKRFLCFKKLLSEISDDVSIIVFVRPFVPWAWSLYNQGIKRHNLSISFEEWARTAVEYFDRLMANLFGFDITIIALPFNRDNLLPMLLEAISEDKKTVNLVPNKTVNRSLSEIEINLLKIANDVFNDPSVSTVISDMLIKEMPLSDAMPISAEIAYQVERFLPKIDDNLDKHDHEKSHKVKEFLHGKYNLENSNEIKTYYKDDVHEVTALIFKAIQNIYLVSDRRISKILKCASDLKKDDSSFDLIHYLLLNLDVLDSNMEPHDHYKRFGSKENRYTHLAKKTIL